MIICCENAYIIFSWFFIFLVQEIEIDDEEIYISDNDLDKQLAPEVLHSE